MGEAKRRKKAGAQACDWARAKAALRAMFHASDGLVDAKLYDLPLAIPLAGQPVDSKTRNLFMLVAEYVGAVRRQRPGLERWCFCCDAMFGWPGRLPVSISIIKAARVANPGQTFVSGICGGCRRAADFEARYKSALQRYFGASRCFPSAQLGEAGHG